MSSFSRKISSSNGSLIKLGKKEKIFSPKKSEPVPDE